MTENINVSIGELWDKYTILLIKKEKINNDDELKYINKELEYLSNNMKKYDFAKDYLFLELKAINITLWDIEDKIRIKEAKQQFDDEFIKLARSVYIINDKRAYFKKRINNKFNSLIHEVKHYKSY